MGLSDILFVVSWWLPCHINLAHSATHPHTWQNSSRKWWTIFV